MSDDEFRILRDSIYRHCGIYFQDDSKYLLERRLARRVSALSLSNFREYYHFLEFDRNKDQEMMDIMDVLTTNETYFFRESYQLASFTDEVIPELISAKSAQGSRRLRIWSAGCSTGEEPYTIAMLLRDIPGLRGWKVEIIGTDISQRVLQHARQGVYTKSSFRATEEENINRFFYEYDRGFKVRDEIREMVSFSHLNLYDKIGMMMLGKMDIIFCRNVIIYFDLKARKRVVEDFHQSLNDGGFLLLGHSESLMNVTKLFTLRHFKNDMIYQKPVRNPSQGEG